jgi:UDP-glucose:glycoprotein glucosyltransferase
LKRTDYIVIDDRDKGDGEAKESSKAETPAESTLQSDDEDAELKPLSTSELNGLGLKAGSFIMNSENPLETFLKLSQDFPKHSGRIAAHNASEEFLNEWKGNALFAIPQGYNVLWINGVQIDARQIDPFSLLEYIRRERKLVSSVQQLGFTGPEAIDLLSHDEISKPQRDDDPQRYDFRDTTEGGNVIVWMNDLEKDKRYEDWPTTIQAVSAQIFNLLQHAR